MQSLKKPLLMLLVVLLALCGPLALLRTFSTAPAHAPAPKVLFGATGDNPAGWTINTGTGNLVAPSGKLLTGLTVNGTATGHVVRYDQHILVQAATTTRLFGDGSDGALTASSGTTTLSRDTNYSSITLTGTAKINTAGFALRCSGTTDLTSMPAGTIFLTGNAGGNGAAGGTAGSAGALFLSTDGITIGAVGQAGTAGGAGGTAGGAQAGAVGARTYSSGGSTATSGAGGSGSGGAGGATRVGITVTRAGGSLFHSLMFPGDFAASGYTSATGSPQAFLGGAGGPGGGGGGGDGTAGGGGGGGGSASVGIYFTSSTVIVTSAAAGVIQAKGGLGGNGGTPAAGNRGGGGGGSGGGGGFVFAAFGTVTGSASGAVSADGGDGGNAGNGTGTGLGGDGGGGAAGGHVCVVNLAANTITTATGTSGSAGNAHSGATGGTGTVGEAVRVSL